MTLALFLRKSWMPAALLAIGLATHFSFIARLAEVVFDEVHFGKFVSAYFTGEYYFDIHPPLGKLLIALAARIAGFEPGFDFATNGEAYGDVPYVALRFLPNLAGALIPLAGFWLARELQFSRGAAFAVGLLLALDNAILVQSHYMLIDGFMLVFGILGLAAFLRARSRGYAWRWLCLAGALLAAAISVKWIGLPFFMGALLLAAADCARGFSLRVILRSIVCLGLVPLAVYVLLFIPHFALLPNPGFGDGYMPQGFREENFTRKFVTLNRVMYTANAANLQTHPWSSRPETWPLMLRPVSFWRKSAGGFTAEINSIGNPAVWWGTTIAGFLALLFWIPERGRERRWLLFALWFGSILPFFPVQRTLFMYHYLPALVFAIFIAVGWLTEPSAHQRHKTIALYSMVALAVILFLYFMPFSYGLYLDDAARAQHFWLPSWD